MEPIGAYNAYLQAHQTDDAQPILAAQWWRRLFCHWLKIHNIPFPFPAEARKEPDGGSQTWLYTWRVTFHEHRHEFNAWLHDQLAAGTCPTEADLSE